MTGPLKPSTTSRTSLKSNRKARGLGHRSLHRIVRVRCVLPLVGGYSPPASSLHNLRWHLAQSSAQIGKSSVHITNTWLSLPQIKADRGDVDSSAQSIKDLQKQTEGVAAEKHGQKWGWIPEDREQGITVQKPRTSSKATNWARISVRTSSRLPFPKRTKSRPLLEAWKWLLMVSSLPRHPH